MGSNVCWIHVETECDESISILFFRLTADVVMEIRGCFVSRVTLTSLLLPFIKTTLAENLLY
jgi:hypothetical protein